MTAGSLQLRLIAAAIVLFADSIVVGDSFLGLAPQALCFRLLRRLGWARV